MGKHLKVDFENGYSGPMLASVLSVDGSLLLENEYFGNDKIEISLEGIRPGVYLLMREIGERKFVKHFVRF